MTRCVLIDSNYWPEGSEAKSSQCLLDINQSKYKICFVCFILMYIFTLSWVSNINGVFTYLDWALSLVWLLLCAGWSFSMGSAYQFHSWRVFVVVCALPCVSAVVALTFMPESPRFYLEVKHREYCYTGSIDILSKRTESVVFHMIFFHCWFLLKVKTTSWCLQDKLCVQ